MNGKSSIKNTPTIFPHTPQNLSKQTLIELATNTIIYPTSFRKVSNHGLEFF